MVGTCFLLGLKLPFQHVKDECLFSSRTQSLVLIEALALYAELVHGDGKDVSVDISITEGNLQQEACHVTNQNDLVMYEFEIHQCPNNLQVFAEGEGCVLFQVRESIFC